MHTPFSELSSLARRMERSSVAGQVTSALGLSLVHTNKMLTRLRERGLASWQNGMLAARKCDALCELAQLEPDREQITRPLI